MIFDNFYNNHPMNVIETSEGWTIELRAVGLKKEDITLEYEPENILVIKTAGKKDEDLKYSRHEFWKDVFRDTRIILPAGVNQDSITARVDNGILSINLKKEKTENKKIEILGN